MTFWHVTAFRIIGPLQGESTDDRWIHHHKGPVMQNFYVRFIVSLSKFLNKKNRDGVIVWDVMIFM